MSNTTLANRLRALLWPTHASHGWFGDLCLLGARLYAGWSIAWAGWDKLPTANWFAGQVAGLGFPLPSLFAFAAATAEFAGGLLILVGLFCRPAAFFTAFTMGVAAFLFHRDVALFDIHVANLYFWVFVALCGVGAGGLSFDRILGSPQPPEAEQRVGPLIPIPLGLAAVALLVGAAGYRDLFVPPTPRAEAASLNDAVSVSLAGDFNNWDLSATPLSREDGARWSADVKIGNAGPAEFKFAINEDWALNLGADSETKSGFPISGEAVSSLDGAPGNLTAYVPRPGVYRFSIDLDTLEYAVEPPASEAE